MGELREGDIYRWTWANPKLDADRGPYQSYHCKSQIAVVKNGQLFDTFWSSGGEGWLDPSEVSLTLWANVSDLTEMSKWEVPYYRPDDIVDLRHSNNSSGPIYRRNGAERDAATILQHVEDKLHEARKDAERAIRRIEELSRDAEKVRAGNLKEVYL